MNIGVLDSGVGGFSILATLEKQFPEHTFVYLSDHKNFPYSEKSISQLQTIGAENAEILSAQGCNPIVLACNTLTVTALAHLRVTFPSTSFIGTVPAVKPAAETLTPGSHIVVLATKNTAESEYLQALIEAWKSTHNWTLVGTTKLVEAIENWNEQAIIAELTEILLPIHRQHPIDGIVLGCTHFPFVEKYILQVLQTDETEAKDIRFFEPSIGIAKQLARAVEAIDSSIVQTTSRTTTSHLNFISSADPAHLNNTALAHQFEQLKQFLPKL